QSLAPGGFLFLGHAETLRGISDRFHLRHTHGTFYYELKSEGAPERAPLAPLAPQRRPASPTAADLGADWFDAIRKASERVAALVPAPSTNGASPGTASQPWDAGQALHLLREERFAEALDSIRCRPAAAEQDPDILLLEATLLAHSGDTA